MLESGSAPSSSAQLAAKTPQTEFIRLLQQALSDLGHCRISRQLTEVTGIACEHAQIQTMRTQIAAGAWLEACESVRLCPDVTQQQRNCVQFVLLREHVLKVRGQSGSTLSICPAPPWIVALHAGALRMLIKERHHCMAVLAPGTLSPGARRAADLKLPDFAD